MRNMNNYRSMDRIIKKQTPKLQLPQIGRKLKMPSINRTRLRDLKNNNSEVFNIAPIKSRNIGRESVFRKKKGNNFSTLDANIQIFNTINMQKQKPSAAKLQRWIQGQKKVNNSYSLTLAVGCECPQSSAT